MSEAILYQMKATDENHGKIFQGLKDDLEINMNDYDEVARINLKEFKKVFKSDIQGMLESIFSYGNHTNQFRRNYPNARSISVSDIIEIDGNYYYCDTFGFKEVTDKVKTKQEEAVSDYQDKMSIEYMAKIFNVMRQNGWDGNWETADAYFDEIMKQIDPNFKEAEPEEQEQAEDDAEPLREELKEIKTENVMYWVETLGVDPYDVNYELNPKALEIIEKFKAAGKLDALFDYFSAGVVDPFENEEDYLEYVADTDISDFEIYNGKLDESEKLQEDEPNELNEPNKNNISINDLGDNSDPENIHHNEDGSEKTIYDYLQDRIGEDMSVGELNTCLQALFGKFNETFLTFDEFYNQDPNEKQELVIWDDEDMYTVTYEIKDQIEPLIEITDINVE